KIKDARDNSEKEKIRIIKQIIRKIDDFNKKLEGEKRLLANAIYFISWQGGWSITSLISGWIQKNLGFTPLFPLTAFLYLLAFSWVLFLFPEEP
ncbi:MAG: hypothetical protein ACK4G3_06000, partial [bacterium]